MKIADCLARANELKSISDSARLDAELLLCDVLGKERSYLFTWPETELSHGQQSQFSALFERRLRGEPVAHILGFREFWSLNFAVNPSTLIPRPIRSV